jgi:hypothetical protein
MDIEITERAAELIRRKGGTAAVDFIRPSG